MINAPAYATRDMLKLALGGRAAGSTTELTIGDGENDLLDLALRAGARMIDRFCGRRFYADPTPVTRTVPLVVTQDGGYPVLMTEDIADVTDLAATSGGVTVGAGAAEAWPPGEIEQGRPATGLLLTSGGWSGRPTVSVRWGWPEYPDEVVQANLLQAARLYRRKDSPEGVAGGNDWGMVRVPVSDPDVKSLLQPFRLPGFGA